jgi:hypothetical protein
MTELALLLLALAGCASAPPVESMPPDVLLRSNPAVDTSHNPTLWESSSGGCNDSSDATDGCRSYTQGCGTPRGAGHGGHAAILGAIVLTLRRRRPRERR